MLLVQRLIRLANHFSNNPLVDSSVLRQRRARRLWVATRKGDRRREPRSALAFDRSIERSIIRFSVNAPRRRKMAKRKRSSASGPRTRSKAAKERREAKEVANARHLDKLPPELWEKILGHLDENDLFPLALSCRYFRQKQKELVARTGRGRQSGRKSGLARLALKTTLRRDDWERRECRPASADYLRFCSKEKASNDYWRKKDTRIQCLAAFHGHLPLLQELVKSAGPCYNSHYSVSPGPHDFISMAFFAG